MLDHCDNTRSHVIVIKSTLTSDIVCDIIKREVDYIAVWCYDDDDDDDDDYYYYYYDDDDDDKDDNVRNDYDEMKVFARHTLRCSVESPLRCVGTGTPFLADHLC